MIASTVVVADDVAILVVVATEKNRKCKIYKLIDVCVCDLILKLSGYF